LPTFLKETWNFCEKCQTGQGLFAGLSQKALHVCDRAVCPQKQETPKTLEKGFRRCALASQKGFEPPTYRLTSP
jgi:hypothetical protein